MPIVKFIREKKEIEVPQGSNLRTEARKAGVDLYPHIHKIANCRGLGTCGSCRVLITKGAENVSPMGTWEKIRFKWVPDIAPLAYLGNEDTMRLACQCQVSGDIEVQTQPPLNLFGENFFS